MNSVIVPNGSISSISNQLNIPSNAHLDKRLDKRLETTPVDLEISEISLNFLKFDDYNQDDVTKMINSKDISWKIIQKQFPEMSILALSNALSSSDCKCNSIVFQSCFLTQKAAKKIFMLVAKNKKFKALQIEKCWFDEKVFLELRRAIASGEGSLKTIKIIDMKCTGEELIKLVRDLIKTKAYTLRLENCVIKAFGIKEELELQKILTEEGGGLSAIEIINLKMGDGNGYAAFFKGIIQTKISLVQIENCTIDANSGIGPALMSALANGGCTVQTLNFYGVTFDVESFKAIATGLIAQNWLSSSVSTLGFESCNLDHRFGESLNYLLNCNHLKILNLQSNPNLGSSIAVQRKLSISRSLDNFRTQENDSTSSRSKSLPRAIPSFTKGIYNNKSLEVLNLSNCNIGEDDYDDLFRDAMREGADERFRINLEGNIFMRKKGVCGKSKRMLTEGHSPRAFGSDDDTIKNRKSSRENLNDKSPRNERPRTRYRISAGESQFKGSGKIPVSPRNVIIEDCDRKTVTRPRY